MSSSAKREMWSAERRERLRKLERKVAVAGRVHAVRGGAVEAERLGRDGAVERERCSCDRSRAQRTKVHALASIGEAGDVALDHADVGEEPVRHEDRLGALQVGVRGHHGFARGDRRVR